MPRTSAAARSTVPVDDRPTTRLNPPATLSNSEQSVFKDIVSACDPKHFRISDLPLLSRYCESVVLADEAARELRNGGAVIDGKPSPWLVVQEKSIRAIVALSMRLRLSPQARLDQKTAARMKERRTRPPWEV